MDPQYSKCKHYRKGGWCSLLQEEKVDITKECIVKIIYKKRCATHIRRYGKCTAFNIRKNQHKC